MQRFFRLAVRNLPSVLQEAHAALIAAGRPELAELYRPALAEKILQAVRTQRQYRLLLNQMIVSENRLLMELMLLGGSSYCPAKVKAAKAGKFIKRWNYVLRRSCLHRDFSELVPACFKPRWRLYARTHESPLPQRSSN